VLDNALHRSLLDIPTIWRRLDQLGDRRPGARRVRALLTSRVGAGRPTESVLETRFRQILRRTGMPMPEPQFQIRVNGSVARVDFAYPEMKLAIELDGAAYHSSWEARTRDRHRENQLVALGWRVLRFTWDDVCKDPEAVMRCVQGAR
jgi:very-short-patch-repair endonuclease